MSAVFWDKTPVVARALAASLILAIACGDGSERNIPSPDPTSSSTPTSVDAPVGILAIESSRDGNSEIYAFDIETGEVLRTEISFEVDSTEYRFDVRIRAEYEANSLLGVLVPDTMEEHYDSRLHSVDVRAYYSNFKRFAVTSERNPGAIVQ